MFRILSGYNNVAINTWLYNQMICMIERFGVGLAGPVTIAFVLSTTRSFLYFSLFSLTRGSV
ncbi:hypothetical protein TMatcc_007857 [Talaromyces marneffei ATCC 18224]